MGKDKKSKEADPVASLLADLDTRHAAATASAAAEAPKKSKKKASEPAPEAVAEEEEKPKKKAKKSKEEEKPAAAAAAAAEAAGDDMDTENDFLSFGADDKKSKKAAKKEEKGKKQGKNSTSALTKKAKLSGPALAEKMKADFEAFQKERKAAKEAAKETEGPLEFEDDRQPRTVFVGNVPLSCIEDKSEEMKAFKKIFKDIGKVESIRFRSIPVETDKVPRRGAIFQKKLQPQRDSCNAYVVFVEESSVAKALKLNNTELLGKHLRVDELKKMERSPESTVFVGNLPLTVNEEAVREHFTKCGSIQYVRLVRDPKTNVGKGIGYVCFEDKDSVRLAIELNQSTFMDRPIRVSEYRTKFQAKIEKIASPKPKKTIGKAADGASPSGKSPATKIRKAEMYNKKIAAKKQRKEMKKLKKQLKRGSAPGKRAKSKKSATPFKKQTKNVDKYNKKKLAKPAASA